jgi:phosphoglycolate phosphatase-like HAD superfamily hydrolase
MRSGVTITFDLDGTLISCAQRQSAVLRSILNSLSVEQDAGQIWRYKRDGSSTEAALIRSGVGVTLAAQIAAQWKRLIEEPYWLSLDRLFSDSLQVLTKLRHQGHNLILLTARSRKDLLMFQLAQLGLRDEFDQIHAVQPATAKEQKSTLLRTLGTRYFVGDTESDFQAAHLAGVTFYGVSTGQRSAPFLHAQGVEQVFATLTEASSQIHDGDGDVR